MFRSCLFSFIFTIISSIAWAGDEPCLATPLPPNMANFVTYDNSSNINSNIPHPDCGNYTAQDIWFESIAPANGAHFIALQAGTMINAAMAIYVGSCDNPNEFICIEDDICGNTDMPIYTVNGLPPGETYFIRIWAEAGTPAGSFSIYVNESAILVPDFVTTGTATYIDNSCIQLTANSTSQQGCAWFPDAVDFSNPIDHTMTAYFGNNNGGADGICLVYQSNNTSQCGVVGSGLGAEGIPNSFILEFDTYQNTDNLDPVNDHASANINGDMMHANSLSGPIVLAGGNIEDGADHIIRFTWDPGLMFYQVYFDGVIYLSGIYDIIGNCFGGSPDAFWGYTSSTGNATNTQVMCPDIQTFEHGLLTFDTATICDNETHFAAGADQNTAGNYMEEVTLPNGCIERKYTHLIVHPTFETDLGTFYTCDDESVEVLGIPFSAEGQYEIAGLTNQNCDSNIVFEIVHVKGIPIGIVNGEITCSNNFVMLDATASASPNGSLVTYIWTSPDGFVTNESQPIVTKPGEYTLQMIIELNGVICTTEVDFVTVTASIDFPSALGGPDLILNCNQPESQLDGSQSSQDPDHTVSWVGPNNFMSSILLPTVRDSGMYILTLTASNGCTSIDTVLVQLDTSILSPVLEVSNTLNCLIDTATIDLINAESGLDYSWAGPGVEPIDTLPFLATHLPGLYFLHISANNGCQTSDSAMVLSEALNVTSIISADTITCSQSMVSINTTIMGFVDSLNWTGPNNFSAQEDTIFVQEPGLYFLTMTDSIGCQTIDSIEIFIDTIAPSFTITMDSITCAIPGKLTISNASAEFTYDWVGPQNFTSTVSAIESIIPGEYSVTVTSRNGCSTSQNQSLFAKNDVPEINVEFGFLNCDIVSTSINVIANQTANSIDWTGPNNFVGSGQMIAVSMSGLYHYIFTSQDGCILADSIFIRTDTIGAPIVLNADSITCNHPEATLNVLSDSTIVSYQWTGPNNALFTSQSPIVENGGLYQIVVTYENGCQTNGQVMVDTFIQKPIVSIEKNDINCLNTEATISISSTDSLTTLWFLPEGEITTGNEVTSSQSGFYRYETENQYGCFALAEIEIKIDTLKPVFNLSVDPIDCVDPMAQLSFSGIDLFDRVVWKGPNQFNSEALEIAVSDTGIYIFLMVGVNGCSDSTEVIVEPYFPIEFDVVTELGACVNSGTVSIQNISGGNPPYQYSIDDGATYSDQPTFSNIAPGLINVLIVDEEVCMASKNVTIEDRTFVKVVLPDQITINTGVEVSLSPEINIPNIQIDSISWHPANALSCQNCIMPTVIDMTVDSFWLQVIDIYGCSDSTFVNINRIEEIVFFIPNAFTPNNDEVNDVFKPYARNQQVETVERFAIFDRWGELVFEQNDMLIDDPNLGWDGQFKEIDAMSGVYTYVLKLNFLRGDSETLKGSITLIR